MPTATRAALRSDADRPETNASLRQEMRARLLALPYRAFLQVILHLLQTQGYSSVHPTGRAHWKGRNRAGGWDAEAEVSASPFGPLRCVVQAKQFDTLAIHQRSVDELRGSALRAGAQQALLITLSTFSPVAKQAAETKTALPVRLLSGEALLTLLLENRIGVVQNDQGRWHLNAFYFGLLQDKFAKRENNRRGDSKRPETSAQSVERADMPQHSRVVASRRSGTLTVTVTVDAPDRGDVQALTSAH